jgi:adenylate kinase family enzyme
MRLDPITDYILKEGYLLSDKTISVNLSDFESGKSNKLLIVGLIASGKTTLGKSLSKKYRVPLYNTDDCEEFASQKKGMDEFVNCIYGMVTNKQRSIVEGIGLVDLFTEFGYEKEIGKYPMIIIGRSVLSSSIKAFQRHYKAWLHQTKINLTMGQKRLDKVRQYRTAVLGADIKEYVIPKL